LPIMHKILGLIPSTSYHHTQRQLKIGKAVELDNQF
jgi:hypothetical protein